MVELEARGRKAGGGETGVSGDPYAAHGSAARTAMRQRAGTRERKIPVEQGGERPPEQPRERLTRSSMQDEGRSNASGYSPTMRRPDLVTFAAIIMFTLGGFHVLLAISEFANSTWVLSRLDIELLIPSLILWGFIDLLIGLIAVYAGRSILSGGKFGWFMGYTFATVGIIRWLFYIPVAPVLAVVIIVIDDLVIYGLAEHADYFQGSLRAGVDVAELERLAQVLDEGLEMLSVLPRHL